MSEATQEVTGPQALRIQRTFDAEPKQIYACFTQAEHLAKWFGPRASHAAMWRPMRGSAARIESR